MDMEEMRERLLAIVDAYQEVREEERKALLEWMGAKTKGIRAETKVILAEMKASEIRGWKPIRMTIETNRRLPRCNGGQSKEDGAKSRRKRGRCGAGGYL
jgi:hypothetical protein